MSPLPLGRRERRERWRKRSPWLGPISRRSNVAGAAAGGENKYGLLRRREEKGEREGS